MSLSQIAAEKAAAEQARQAVVAKTRRAQEREEIVKKLMETWKGELSELAQLGCEIRWIDTRTVEYPRRGQHHVYVTNAQVHRYQVDDVIVWVLHDSHGNPYFTPEVECCECGREFGARLSEGAVLADGSDGNALLRALQYTSGRELRCPWCTTQMSRVCPTCGRGNI